MSPGVTFFVGLGLLILFGWYFATDLGPRKRFLATLLMVLLVLFSIATIWPPKEKIALGLDIQGGTSFRASNASVGRSKMAIHPGQAR